MIRYALITHDFRVPCATDDGVFLSYLGALDNLDTVICLGQRGDGWNLISSPPRTLWYDFLSGRHNRAITAGNIDIETTDEIGIVRLKEKKRYVYISDQGKIDVTDNDIATLNERELFRLMTWDGLRDLWRVTRCSWSLGPQGEHAEIDEWKSTFRSIQFGSLRISFDVFCHAVSNKSADQEILLTTSRNIYRAVVYRPGILYIAFGEKVLRELQAALKSLRNPGYYEGDILIATDHLPEQIYSVVPPSMRNQCRIIKVSAFDYSDYVSTRQMLLSSGELDQYAPLLYMDGDVVVNTPIEPILLGGALAPMASAQLEVFNIDFRYSKSSGELLFSKDPYDCGRIEAGFNAGVFLVPNVRAMRHLLDPAFYTNIIFSDMNGRGSIPFDEQSVMNYALRKVDAFDATFINNITDVGGDRRSPVVQQYGNMAPSRARGFVHFWCYGGVNRGLPMEHYMREVRNYRRRKGIKYKN